MPDHAKQVGVLCQHVIDLLGLTMKEGQSILLGESNIAHMVSNHPADYALYGEYIPLILSAPDYVALNAKDSSIEYVKEVQVNSIYVKVAVRVSARGQLFARSIYRLNTNRVLNFIEKGTLKRY
ncbi:PBECR2 nuclease fold domain-containing protein [Faecalibacterium prausnitzii]|jgi:hypothetical protein|uniref:PBECR3 domain-containing polyvalent protein n=1 Tax=Oscillospiraceae TaxID=216572 RepID=UPI001CBDAF63|nr:PBECR2 nuclease fold domain-containing protein [Faecalibacterium prausnitzii]